MSDSCKGCEVAFGEAAPPPGTVITTCGKCDVALRSRMDLTETVAAISPHPPRPMRINRTWCDPVEEYGFLRENLEEPALVGRGSTIIFPELVAMAPRTRLDSGVYLSTRLHLGGNSAICAGAQLIGGPRQQVFMGEWTFIGYQSLVMASSERYDRVAPVNQAFYQPLEEDGEEGTSVYGRDVIFNDHSGVASGCIVFPGVELPEGALVGDGSRVRPSSTLIPWWIHRGDPLTPVRPRPNPELIKERAADVRRWKEVV